MKKKKLIAIFSLLIIFIAFSVFTAIKYKSQVRPAKDKSEKSLEKMDKVLSIEPIKEIKKDSIVISVKREVEDPVEEKPDTIESPRGGKKKAEAQPLREGIDMPAETIAAISIEKPSKEIGDKIVALPVEKKIALPVETVKTIPAEEPPIKIQKKADVLPDVRVIEIPLSTPAPEVAGKDVTGLEKKIEVIPSKEKITMPPDEVKTAVKKISVKVVRNRVAVLPFENLTDDKAALRHVMPFVIGRLEERGLEVVDEENLNTFLCKERVRATGYVSKELAGKIRDEFGVETVLAGAIISFSTEEIPRFGILARLINSSDGRILWAGFALATGDDFITILGLGKLHTIFGLIPKVTDMLLADFSIEGIKRKAEPSYKIAVMPFLNNSDHKNAGIIAMYMFIIELLKNQKFEPIEYGNIRDLIISLRIRNKGELNFNNINALSEPLNANGILVGIVGSYENGLDTASTPKVAITARLLDGRTSKILWYNSHELSGEENIVILDWGRIRAVHKVAYGVVANLVKKMGAVSWH